MNYLLLALLSIPLLLGSLVILQVIARVGKNALERARGRRAQRGTATQPVAMLDQPFPCPTCTRLDMVAVRRADYQQMPYVEHFLCHACGTEFLGPNQLAMVQKRVKARDAFRGALDGQIGNYNTKIKSIKP